jgi:thiamine kinase-like enzyme
MREAVPSKATIESEMEEMRRMVEEMKLPLLLCHNDVNPTNCIYNRENGR